MMKFAKEVIVLSSFDNGDVEDYSYHRLRIGPFKGVIGAIDKTLINASIAVDKQTSYRSRGGKECFQNVKGVCDFNMKFVYMMAGWEGVAHDRECYMRHFAIRGTSFLFPPKVNIMCDVAYTHTRGFLCSYRRVRYWLPKFCRVGVGRGDEERFNHAHARLRNVIEHIFCVLKARFKILYKMPPYNYKTQLPTYVTTGPTNRSGHMWAYVRGGQKIKLWHVWKIVMVGLENGPLVFLKHPWIQKSILALPHVITFFLILKAWIR